jgi:hypothetical protein
VTVYESGSPPEDRDRRSRLVLEIADVAFDERDLVDVREGQIVGCGQDPDGAAFDPAVAVAVVGLGVADLDM